MRTGFLLSIILFCLAMAETSFANSQWGILAGLDRPETGSSHAQASGLLRFQLQTKPKMFRLQTAFNTAFGSNLLMGEFNIGPAIYLLSALMEEARLQPFLGAEGIATLGSKDQKTALGGGYGIFAGVDLRVFGKTSGLTVMFEQANIGQSSIRFWLGFYLFKLQ